MVPGGQSILATTPCLVLGQEMSIITSGLQYSTRMLGSLEEGGALSSSSGAKPSNAVRAGATTFEVVRGHWAPAAVVAGILVVVVLATVDVMVTVVGRVVLLAVVVVVSMKTITEEDVSGREKKERIQNEVTCSRVEIKWRSRG